MRLRIGSTLVALLLCFTTSATGLDDGHRSYRELEWLRQSDTNTVARGLWEFRRSPLEDRVVLLFETASGHRYVLSHVADPATGTMYASITDDASRWKCELIVYMGLNAGSIAAWYSRFGPELITSNHSVKVEARTSAGSKIGPVETPYVADSGEYEALLADPTSTAGRGAFATEMPENLRSDLPMLLAAFTLENQYGFHMRGLVAMLSGITGTTTAEADMTVVSASDVAPNDLRIAQFASHFKTHEAVGRRTHPNE